MIKNLAIGGVVGLLFMVGGFFGGLHFVHVPAPKKAVATVVAAKAPVPRDAISIEALRRTSEGMMDVSQALQAREQAVAEREKKAREREDELDAERAALDRSHAKFHELYSEFEQRLQLVKASEADQLQRQITIYNAMDPSEAADLIRSLDDSMVVRLFSMMDTKPLAGLVSAWKAKYPGDSVRLLTALTQMGRVMPEDKMALNDSAAPSNTAGDTAPTTESISNAGPAPEAVSAPANIAASDTGTPTTTDASAPAADAAPASDATSATPAPSATSDADNTATSAPAAPDAAPAAQPADSSPAPQSADSAPDASTPAGTSSAPAPASASAPAAPALAPPTDSTVTPGSASTSTPNDTSDSTASLGVPGETAAQAAEAAQRRTGRLSADISNVRAY